MVIRKQLLISNQSRYRQHLIKQCYSSYFNIYSTKNPLKNYIKSNYLVYFYNLNKFLQYWIIEFYNLGKYFCYCHVHCFSDIEKKFCNIGIVYKTVGIFFLFFQNCIILITKTFLLFSKD